MKQKLINIKDDHYVLVDESSPIPGRDIVYSYVTNTIVTFTDPRHFSDGTYKKITHSTQPLELLSENGLSGMGFSKVRPLNVFEVKELIGEVDVEKKATDYSKTNSKIESTGAEEFGRYWGFKEGYNQALEDSKEKKYTEEDMITAFEKGTNAGALSERLYDYDNGDYEEAPQYYKQQKESFIQSLQPKTEWEVTFDEQGKLR